MGFVNYLFIILWSILDSSMGIYWVYVRFKEEKFLALGLYKISLPN